MTAKIVCMSSTKGGVGKSVSALNFGVYESLHHKRVLFIDLDDQKDLTIVFSHQLKPAEIKNASIIRAFKHDAGDPMKPFPKDFKPAKVNNHISIITGSSDIKGVGDLMSKRKNMESFVVLHMLTALKLLDKFDLVIIDTHNSFQLPTINGLVVADYIFSPITPSLFSITAMGSMITQMKNLKQSFFDVKTGKSDINAKLYFIGDLTKNTKASRQFNEYVKQSKDFIATFKQRELVNKAINNYQSVYAYANDSKHYKARHVIKKEINPQFKNMDKVISK